MNNAASASSDQARTEVCTACVTGVPEVRVLLADETSLQAYADLFADCSFSPSQSPSWAHAWLSGRDGILVLVTHDGEPALGLALEIVPWGPFRIARFAGGRHANGNFPAIGRALDDRETALAEAARAIVKARPDIDLLALERQRPDLEGTENPLLILPHAASPDISLAADLRQGFEGLLRRRNSRRRGKKYRSALRVFIDAGGYRILNPQSEHEAEAMLQGFFEMKQRRLTRSGVADRFEDLDTRSRFQALFGQAQREPQPPFFLRGLEVAGKLRAVAGFSRTKKTVICDFLAFAEDELSRHSPGQFLTFECIKDAAETGMRFYDFSVGDEAFKRSWAEIETQQKDVFLALNVRGKLAATARSILLSVRRTAKSFPTVMQATRFVRKQKARR